MGHGRCLWLACACSTSSGCNKDVTSPPPLPCSPLRCTRCPLWCRGASAADVRKAYKRLALMYHPDKHKGEGEEQQAAIADKFKQAGLVCFPLCVVSLLVGCPRVCSGAQPGSGAPPPKGCVQ